MDIGDGVLSTEEYGEQTEVVVEHTVTGETERGFVDEFGVVRKESGGPFLAGVYEVRGEVGSV